MHGSRNVVTASDSSGMTTAAKQDTPNISTFTVTPSHCTCGTSSTVAACPSTYCTNAPQANYVEVDAQLTFNPLIILFRFDLVSRDLEIEYLKRDKGFRRGQLFPSQYVVTDVRPEFFGDIVEYRPFHLPSPVFCGLPQ
jgi:hypothetical protein